MDMKLSNLFIRKWHRRLALILGAFLVFQGLTGAVSQYRFWLMQQTDPAMYRADVKGAAATPGQIIATLKAELPGFEASHVMYPAENAPEMAVIVMGGREKTGRNMSRLVTVDQYGRSVIQEGPIAPSWVGIAGALHKWSILGVTGRILLTVLGLGTMCLAALGLMLRWRTRRMKTGGMIGIHRTLGIFVAILLLCVSTTGTLLNLFTWYESSNAKMVTRKNMAAAMGTAYVAPKVDIDTAYNAAQVKIGGQHVIAFSPAGRHAKNYWFAFTDWKLERTDVLVDAQTGVIEGVYPSGLTDGGDGLRGWLFPIHSGYIVGQIGGAVMTVMGLALTFWFVSGILIWRRTRPRKLKSKAVPA